MRGIEETRPKPLNPGGPMFKLLVVTLIMAAVMGTARAETKISAKVGQEFSVSLESNPSTGYKWDLESALDESKILKVRSEYVPSGSNRIGAAGKEVWVFKALSPGDYAIKMKYARPWEKDTAPAKTATFEVSVR